MTVSVDFTQRGDKSIISLFEFDQNAQGGRRIVYAAEIPPTLGDVAARMPPETIWAVNKLWKALTFFRHDEIQETAELRAAMLGVSDERVLALVDAMGEHFAEYPGKLTLVPMTRAESEEAELEEKRSGKPVVFSWKKLPGVLDSGPCRR